jgi:hypothetical protein
MLAAADNNNFNVSVSIGVLLWKNHVYIGLAKLMCKLHKHTYKQTNKNRFHTHNNNFTEVIHSTSNPTTVILQCGDGFVVWNFLGLFFFFSFFFFFLLHFLLAKVRSCIWFPMAMGLSQWVSSWHNFVVLRRGHECGHDMCNQFGLDFPHGAVKNELRHMHTHIRTQIHRNSHTYIHTYIHKGTHLTNQPPPQSCQLLPASPSFHERV